MSKGPKTIVIIGGVAGGASAACRARRVNEHVDIILFEKDEYVSFANCGLPYYLGGEIKRRGKLLVATAEFLIQRFRLDVRTRQEVIAIDRADKTVTVLDHASGKTYQQGYDKLILAPGASPVVPPLDGVDTKNVFTLRNIEDTDAIKVAMKSVVEKRAVVVGAGFIGLEMVEQLAHKGFEVTLIELQPQVLPLLDHEMAQPLDQQLREKQIKMYLGRSLQRVLSGADSSVRAVELDDGTQLDASLVILGIGVRPNNQLAVHAELPIGKDGGIETDEFMRTEDTDVYAVGDAVQYRFGPTGRAMRVALAGPANRAGRLAGQHAATGSSATMANVCGTSIVRVFEQTAAMTGLTMKRARQLKVPAKSVTIVANCHAGYYPGATPITLKLVFDPYDGRILGAQAIGVQGIDKRIDVIATAMGLGASVRDLAGLDLTYAPPFGSAKDPVHLAAFAAGNQLDGVTDFLDADANLVGLQVVDVRRPSEVTALPLAGVEHAINIPLDELRERLGELDKNAQTVVSCLVGLRAHVASCILRQSGFDRVQVLSGGATQRARSVPRPECDTVQSVPPRCMP